MKTTKAETYNERAERIAKELLSLKLTFEQFAARCTCHYDDRFRWHDWRVRADDSLDNWIFDVIRNKTEENYTKQEVIQLAYGRFCDIQMRKGQLNWHSVYVKNVEEIYAVAPKPGGNVVINTARLSIVRDCEDRLWRWGTSYFVNNSGRGSGAWFDGNKSDSRAAAILAASESILVEITGGWEYQEDSAVYQTFINKLKKFIDVVKSEIRQPSLF